MREPSRLLLVACAALCSLAIGAVSASARRAIRVQPAGEITKVVEEFTVIAFGGEVQIRCRLVLRGSLSAVIEKASASRLPAGVIGKITSGEAEGCRTNFGGAARLVVLVEPNRPFELRYESFLGALPNITGILFSKLHFEFEVTEPFILGVCLYSGQVGLLIVFPPAEERGRRFNNENFNVPNAVPLFAGIACPATVEISGRGRLTPPQRVVLID